MPPFDQVSRETQMTDSTEAALAIGEVAVLRDRIASDVECHLRWQSQGEWRDYDAPWVMQSSLMSEEEKEQCRARFLQSCNEVGCGPRVRATITTKAGVPVGWVNRYGDDRFPGACCIGIDICEDGYLNRGIGTEALGLWVSYLFAHSDLHRIGVETWSFNERMARVAEKLGFTFEGAQREMIEWQGEWRHRLHYGLLRGEWEDRHRLDA